MSLIQYQTMDLEKLKVYVCHRGSQKIFARELANSLIKTDCIDTFFDERDLPAGADLLNRLTQEIQDSDYFLAIISTDMLDSSWIEHEIDEAFRKCESIRREFIIPILLPNVDESKLPEPLQGLLCLKLQGNDQIAVKLLTESVIMRLFRTVGMHFRGKSKRPTQVGFETKERLATKRELADLDFPSFQSFYHACKKANSGTFFNVQISSDEWFAPNLQIHLAIQEGMAQCIRWTSDSPKEGEVSNKHMPFRRVSFIACTKTDLMKDFENAKPSAKHLCALMHIHNLMACPLAIVTVDELVHIIASHFEFFSSPAVERVIGIPLSVVQLASPQRRGRNGSYTELRDKLLTHVTRQARDVHGCVEPSMDFAIFRHGENGAGSNSIWGGKVASDGALVYFEIPNTLDYRSGKLTFPPKLEGIEFKTQASPQEIHSCLREFSEIIEEHVFRDRGGVVEPPLTTEEDEYLRSVFALNPVASVLGVQHPPNFDQLTKVRKKFCPWMLLYKFLESTVGIYQNDIKSVRIMEHYV